MAGDVGEGGGVYAGFGAIVSVFLEPIARAIGTSEVIADVL